MILSAAFIIGCIKLEHTSGQKELSKENVLRYDVNNSFASLNPASVEASGSNHIFPLLYSYLFVPDSSGKLQPDLAVKWSFDARKLQWTIHLRKNAVFHNNKRVTSKDVKYSYENMLKNMEPEIDSVIGRISLLSDDAICIHLKKECPSILYKIWDIEITPYPAGKEIDYYHHPIGSGPFKFKYRDKNKKVVLEANADYYNGRPSLDEIIFFYQPEKEKGWTRLLSGKTDIVEEITPKDYKMLQQYQSRFYFDQYTLHFYTILLYNTYDRLFSNPKVRRALSLAIDRRYIVENILNGYGRVANGPMGVDSPFHNPEVKPLPYNPQKALALFKEAGWSYDQKSRRIVKGRKSFEFTILVSKESLIEKEVARYIQLCLNDLGIKVRIQGLAFENLKRKYIRNTEFQAVLTELVGAYRSAEFIKTQWSSGLNRKANAGCFENAEVNRLIRHIFDQKKPEKQKKIFYEIDSLITSLQPGTFLFQKTAINVMPKRFRLHDRFSLTYEGIYNLQHAVLRSGFKTFPRAQSAKGGQVFVLN